MKIALLLLLAVFAFVISEARPKWSELDGYSFEQYVKDFKKSYSGPQEYIERKTLFTNRLENIREHNSNPNYSWKRGINHLSDLHDSEFKKLLGYKKGLKVDSTYEKKSKS